MAASPVACWATSDPSPPEARATWDSHQSAVRPPDVPSGFVDQDGLVLANHSGVEEADLSAWCRLHLGSEISDVLFCTGHLSTVVGVELTSARRVVVKLRPPSPRLLGCAVVHRWAFDQGFPCPEPLVDPAPLGNLVASAEAMTSGGAVFPTSSRAPTPFATALVRLVELAPRATGVPSLDPQPAWTRPDFARSELWPTPDDRTVDLNGRRDRNGSTRQDDWHENGWPHLPRPWPLAMATGTRRTCAGRGTTSIRRGTGTALLPLLSLLLRVSPPPSTPLPRPAPRRQSLSQRRSWTPTKGLVGARFAMKS